jgi:hypothetical protein
MAGLGTAYRVGNDQSGETALRDFIQPMSASGQKATFPSLWRISALPQKADID